MATAQQTEEREKARDERLKRERDDREQREKDEEKNRKEGRERANKAAEEGMDKAEPPDMATVYESVRQLTIIAENQHNDSNLALVSLAKAVLGLLPYVLKRDPIHHLHGRNVPPGVKSDAPVRIGPEPKGETPATDPLRVQDERKQEYEEGVEAMHDQSDRDRERAEAADPSKPRRDDRPEGEHLPAEDRPGTRPGERPDHDLPNPPPNRPDDDRPGRAEPKRS
jgi:hypothetical protein